MSMFKKFDAIGSLAKSDLGAIPAIPAVRERQSSGSSENSSHTRPKLALVPTVLIHKAMEHVQQAYELWNIAPFMTDADWTDLKTIDEKLEQVMLNPPSQTTLNLAVGAWERQTLQVFKQARLRK